MNNSKPKQKQSKWLLALGIILSPLLLVVIPAVLILALAAYLVSTISLHILIWSCWCARGRDVLFVYSDSPIWHDYIERHILPCLGERAVVLNWSQHKQWRLSLAKMAFYHFGSYRQFNPLGVVFHPFRRTQTFRFWQPFRDFKHGNPESLRKVECEFFSSIGVQRNELSA